MLYARFASGYRPGNTNGPVSPVYQSSPDKTQTYELGTKGSFFEHTISVDASVYYIDWKNIQLQSYLPDFTGYISNSGGAKSEGAEVSIEWRPLQGLTVSAWGAYDNAVLTQDTPPSAAFTYGLAGDRLPFSSRMTGNASLRQEFPLAGGWTGFLGGTTSYVGKRLGNFGYFATSARDVYPAYWKTDLAGGIVKDPWALNLYANNVMDRRGVLAGGTSFFPAFAYQYIPPRSIGLSLRRAF